MNILELRVKLGIFKEKKVIESVDLQRDIEEYMNIIFDYLEKLMKDEDVSDIVFVRDKYLGFIANLSGYFLNAPINDDVCDYFNFITETLFNWNRNSIKDFNIEIFSLLLNRMVETRNSLTDGISVMKDANERYIELANWQPPVFDLAVEYFDKLLEENEKQAKEGCKQEVSCS
jgi:hypothetical protein